jgi:hypothetical protein
MGVDLVNELSRATSRCFWVNIWEDPIWTEDTVNGRIRNPRAASAFLLALGSLEIAALLLAFEKPARAYVDPGSGFVFLQVAGSMMAGALFYLRHRLKKLFGFARKADQQASPASSVRNTEATEIHS